MPERLDGGSEPPPSPSPHRCRHAARNRIEPDSQLAILPAPLLAQEPDLDELDAAAYAAAHGMPPPTGDAVTVAMDGTAATTAMDVADAMGATTATPVRAMAGVARGPRADRAARAVRAVRRRRSPIRRCRPTATGRWSACS